MYLICSIKKDRLSVAKEEYETDADESNDDCIRCRGRRFQQRKRTAYEILTAPEDFSDSAVMQLERRQAFRWHHARSDDDSSDYGGTY